MPYRSTICIYFTKHGVGRFVYLLPLFIFEFKMLFILFLLKFVDGILYNVLKQIQNKQKSRPTYEFQNLDKIVAKKKVMKLPDLPMDC